MTWKNDCITWGIARLNSSIMMTTGSRQARTYQEGRTKVATPRVLEVSKSGRPPAEASSIVEARTSR